MLESDFMYALLQIVETYVPAKDKVEALEQFLNCCLENDFDIVSLRDIAIDEDNQKVKKLCDIIIKENGLEEDGDEDY